jgi:RNA polymerase sigma factor (sigma-70 family)
MSSGEILKGVVQHLREHLGEAPTDLELLAQYTQRRDEAAFAALVRRHGGLVLGVARRQLPDIHQADDVFQATFLALARSATKLRRDTSLANWLYTVALRQARKARLRAARRAAQEHALTPRAVPTADPLAAMSGRELLALIDEELARLPEPYRQPLLLCCVQGLSREEAARQLGWSDGAVKGRLERGRRQLAARLTKRGLAPSALVLAPLGAVAVPGDLVARTTTLSAAPWSKATSAAVFALAATGAPSRMPLAVALLASLVVAGLIGLAAGVARQEPPAATPPPPSADRPIADHLDDPLPAGSTVRFGTARFRHGTAIEGLAVSADDRIAVTASGNHWLGSARAFDLATGRVLYNLDRTGYVVEAVGLSPDGRTLATNQGNTIHLHDAATGQELRKIALPDANPRTMTQWLTVSPDGKALAVTSEGKVIHLLDLATGTVARSFPHQQVVFTAVFSSDGRLMAAGGYDSERGTYFARLWEAATGKDLRHFANGQAGIRTLAFAPDGLTLAGGGDDGRVRLWDVATGKMRRTFPANGRRIRSVAFTPDGHTVAAAGATIRLYDLATGQEQRHIDRQALGLHFSADGRTLTAAVAGAVYRWDAATGRALTPELAGDSAVDQILVTPDGRRLITRDQAGQLHIWDALTGRYLRRLEVQGQRSIALSPDGRFLAWSVHDPKVKFKDPQHANWTHEGSRLRFYDLVADRLIDRFPGYPGEAWDLAFTPDDQTLVTVDHRDSGVRLWDLATGKERRAFRMVRAGEQEKSYCVWLSALSPDGRTLAVGYQRSDNTTGFFADVVVRLWDGATGKELHELTGHTNQVLGLAFAPDGRLLATCGENPGGWGLGERSLVDRVFVWDVATGKRVTPLPQGLPIGAGSAAFAPDGRTLATASADGVIRLWEVASWTVRAEFRGHRDRVSALTFAPDGRLLSGSLDTTVLAWDVRPPRAAGGGQLVSAWDDLALAEAAPAFKAQGRLREASAEAVALLAVRVKPAEPVDPKRLAAWIADLDSPKFATRQQATAALKQLGTSAMAALRAAQDASGSLEMRRRVGALLEELEKTATPSEELRALRAVEVLEWIGTPEARRLLARLAKGDPGARLTQAADRALKRLDATQPNQK